jgi:protein-L-isoaspartate(D-aspartate) O-methyltransferase
MRIDLPVVLTALTLGSLGTPTAATAQSLRQWRQLAETMVADEIVAAGVTNDRVLRALRNTPRHEFVPTNQREHAYLDMALPIGAGQTISPPFVVAYMTQELDPQPTDRVLEIGTGSGYQAALLSHLAQEVYTIEIVDSLARRSTRNLKRLHYDNVHTKAGDGYAGWPAAAPFDKIIVTCSPESIPKPLVEQLAEGGRMVVPIGERYQQNLHLLQKQDGKLVQEALRATLFVPMTGAAESQRTVQPDPMRPQVTNGSFENGLANNRPDGWHYQRQLTVIEDRDTAPAGTRFVQFQNEQPGRGCRALQGFAVDGRKIGILRLSFFVRGKNIRYGLQRDQWPQVIVTFYNHDRQAISNEKVGPFFGNFAWRQEKARLAVPLQAREAILRIGLLGATGEISFDQIELSGEAS